MKRLIRTALLALSLAVMAVPAATAQRHQGAGHSNRSTHSERVQRNTPRQGSDRRNQSARPASQSARPSGRPSDNRGNSSSSRRPGIRPGGNGSAPGTGVRPAVRPGVDKTQQVANEAVNINPRPDRPGNGGYGPNGGNRPGIGNGGNNGHRPNGGNRPGDNGGYRPGHGGDRPGLGNGGNRPGNRPNGGNRPGDNGGYGPGHGGDRPGHGGHPGGGWGGNHRPGPGGNNWSHRPGGHRPPVMPPPHRPYRPPMMRPHYRPVPPPAWRPGPGPVVRGVLGLTFGTAFNISLDYLYNNGYTVDGYANDVVYLRNVQALNLIWNDAALYYGNAGFDLSSFYYSSPRYDMTRYNRCYDMLYSTYGAPYSMNNVSGVITSTWFAGANGYITLTFGAGNGGRFLTTLSFGM